MTAHRSRSRARARDAILLFLVLAGSACATGTSGAPDGDGTGGAGPGSGTGGAAATGAGGAAPSGVGGATLSGAGGAARAGTGGASTGAGGVTRLGTGGAAGGASGAAGAIMRGANPTEATASTAGPYHVMRYSSGIVDSPSYGDYDVDYPADATPPFAGVAVIPGFIEGRSAVGNWGPFLASHGFVVITIDPNTNLDVPSTRATALWAAVGSLKDENTRAGSPLVGKMDVTRFAVMGHSMGGGGTLEATNTHSAELKAAVPLAPWDTTAAFGLITAPTLIFAGEKDTVAPPAQHAMAFYNGIPASTTKAYAEVTGGDHYAADDPTTSATVALLGLSWLKVHVEGDTRYRPFIKTRPDLSQFLTAP